MEILIVLVWLQVKHWIVDFILQTDSQVKTKGIYGNPTGISHSIDHVIGSLIALLIASSYVSIDPGWIIIASLVDGILHYHIDYVKMRYGNRDITNKEFWSHLGLDQMAHQMCYLLMILIIF